MRASCRCWGCRRKGGLTAVAPTLTAAYFADLALTPARSEARSEVLRAERLLVHRELQLLRASYFHSRDYRYQSKRQRKLDQARRIVARAKARVEELA